MNQTESYGQWCGGSLFFFYPGLTCAAELQMFFVFVEKIGGWKMLCKQKVWQQKAATPTERVGRVIDFLLVCVFLLCFFFWGGASIS